MKAYDICVQTTRYAGGTHPYQYFDVHFTPVGRVQAATAPAALRQARLLGWSAPVAVLASPKVALSPLCTKGDRK